MSELAGRFPLTWRTVALAASQSGVQLCQANPLRWGLLLGWANSSALTPGTLGVSPDPTAAFGSALLLNPGTVLEWHYRAYPGMTTAAWYACTGVGGPATVFVVESVAQQ